MDINTNRRGGIMRRFLTYTILFIAITMNIYLIFYWKPKESVLINKDLNVQVSSYSKSLYKINKDKIIEQMDSNDKKDLRRIVSQLSSFDIGRIKEYFNSEDNDEGLIGAFKLLKRRLNTSEYNRIKDIFTPFIDTEELEKLI